MEKSINMGRVECQSGNGKKNQTQRTTRSGKDDNDRSTREAETPRKA